ncbi:MarR family winged helix-turn-helix transcriptional regulator [Duganella sp.]|uniref:MarR family winged helix-turn-helix transcriptional regulator n=1 Tax=Duganella sp. TaxID=1904440 RepID=UPI0031DB0D14
MSGHIKALEALDLVKRDAPDPDDRRRSGLLLSAHGAAVLADIRERRRDWLARRLTGSGAILAQQVHGRAANAMLYRHAIGNIFSAGTVLVGFGLLMHYFRPEQPLAASSPSAR